MSRRVSAHIYTARNHVVSLDVKILTTSRAGLEAHSVEASKSPLNHDPSPRIRNLHHPSRWLLPLILICCKAGHSPPVLQDLILLSTSEANQPEILHLFRQQILRKVQMSTAPKRAIHVREVNLDRLQVLCLG